MPQIRYISKLHASLMTECTSGSLYHYQLCHKMEHCIASGQEDTIFALLHDIDFQHDQSNLPNGLTLQQRDLEFALAHTLFSTLPLEKNLWLLNKMDMHVQKQNKELSRSISNLQLTQESIAQLEPFFSSLPEQERALLIMTLIKEEWEHVTIRNLLCTVYNKHILELEPHKHFAIEWFVDWLHLPQMIQSLDRLKLRNQDDLLEALTPYKHLFSKKDWILLYFSLSSKGHSFERDEIVHVAAPIHERIELFECMLKICTFDWDLSSACIYPILKHIALDSNHREQWRQSKVRDHLLFHEQKEEHKHSWTEIFDHIVIPDAYSKENTLLMFRLAPP